MDENCFDAIILGTGLVESILAGALAKAGYKIAHVDPNSYYGAEEASLSLDDFVQWADNLAGTSTSKSRFHSMTRSQTVPPQTRHYSICLRPTIIPSVGSLISSLISSGVAKYSGFRLLDCVSVYDSSGIVKNVPGSKEDIFKSKEISLIEKRRLMRFLTFASGDFEAQKEMDANEERPFLEFLQSVFNLSSATSTIIAYSLAFCLSDSEPTLPVLRRLRSYLRSSGRYGSSPFLIGHYGGIGDIAQGFCRAAAVNGGVYILGRDIISLSYSKEPNANQSIQSDAPSTTNNHVKFCLNLTLSDIPDPLLTNLIISSPSHSFPDLPDDICEIWPFVGSSKLYPEEVARCIAIIDRPPLLRPQVLDTDSAETPEVIDSDQTSPGSQDQVDTAIVVFPPGSVAEGSENASVTAFITGEGSLSTPKDRWIVYIALPVACSNALKPQDILQPYLNALLSLTRNGLQDHAEPLFTTFYMERRIETRSPDTSNVRSQKRFLVPAPLQSSSLPDLSDEAAKIAEETFVEAVKILRASRPFSSEEEIEEIAFWPPLPVEDDTEEEW